MIKNQRLKNIGNLLLKVSISALLLFFLFRSIDFSKTFLYIRTIQCLYFGYALAIFVLLTYVGIIRWHILLKAIEHNATFGRIVVAYCGGLFFNVCLPSSIGGDVARAIDLSLDTKNTAAVFATVFLDRLLGFLALVVVATLGFLYGSLNGVTEDAKSFIFIAILGVLLCIVFLMFFSKRTFNLCNKLVPFQTIKTMLEKFHASCYVFRSEKKALFLAFVLSIVIQGAFSFVMYFIGVSLGISVHLVYYLVFIPIVSAISILPIAVGGLGTRDYAAVILFSAVGVAKDRVVAMTLLNFALLFFVGIVGGIVYGIALYRRRIQCNTQDSLA